MRERKEYGGSTGEEGRHADAPSEIPAKGWKQVAKRVISQLKEDHLQIVAAGVAFYFFLALFPTLTAAVSVYGLIVEPSQVQENLSELARYLPQQAHDAIEEIALQISQQSDGALGWGLAIGLLLSIWSMNKGTKALFEGLNIAYDEDEERGFFKQLGLTLLFTLVVAVVGVISIALVATFPAVVDRLPISDGLKTLFSYSRWPVLAVLICVTIGLAYRLGPHRDSPKVRWISWGATFSTLLWVLGSALFSLYVDNFAKFGETYGSFAAVVILMLWFQISAFIILLGGEINSELEHQTARDTTVGPREPMGERGAYHADHVAR